MLPSTRAIAKVGTGRGVVDPGLSVNPEDSVVLARLDANVTNLIAQVTEIKAAQASLVSRERLEIEMKARETDYSRLQTAQLAWESESKQVHRDQDLRVDNLERALNQARGALWILGGLGILATSIIGVFLGHLYLP